MSYDLIENLPTDKSVPNNEELYLLNVLFKDDRQTRSLINGLREALLAGLLFLLLSIPSVDSLIESVIPPAKNKTVLIVIKIVIMIVLFFVIQNFALSKAPQSKS